MQDREARRFDHMSRPAYQDLPGSAQMARFDSLLIALALSSLISTILLIMVGNFVRVTGYGLGCPDWPLCYGRAVPPLNIGAWVEFSHRLFGGIVGLQIAALAILSWVGYRRDKWIFRPSIIAGVVLLFQVSLGGFHVLNELPQWTGLIHTGVALAIAGLLAIVVAATQPSLRAMSGRFHAAPDESDMSAEAVVAATATYMLLLTGSLVTRTGSSLACPDFPLCGLESISEQLRPFVTIQLIHRIAAIAVALFISLILWRLARRHRHDIGVRRLVISIGVLLIIQFGLGISNILLVLPIWSRVLHLGVGASIWVLMVILAVLLYRARAPIS
jgi:heme A synthase